MDVSKANLLSKEAVEVKIGSDVCVSTVKITVLEIITRLELSVPIFDVKEVGKADMDVSEAENSREVPEPRFSEMGMLLPDVLLIPKAVELAEISSFAVVGS